MHPLTTDRQLSSLFPNGVHFAMPIFCQLFLRLFVTDKNDSFENERFWKRTPVLCSQTTFFHLRLPTWASVEAHSAGLNHYFEDDLIGTVMR